MVHVDEHTAFLRNVGNISHINTKSYPTRHEFRAHCGENPTSLKKYVKERLIVIFEFL